MAEPQAGVHGLLARQYCNKPLPLQVLQSQAGYYIGTCDQEGPVSRESVEYFPTADLAHEAHRLRAWTQRMQP
ncbi:MAG TPA: hypothetical protein PK805_00685 [Acidovorax temperans]|jgi:hypothetical protein|nr:hypothetical protein [Acidovorax temperans]